jgi:4-amino-4-deoxy-L-arabinose transferase-like glycosyltransferase
VSGAIAILVVLPDVVMSGKPCRLVPVSRDDSLRTNESTWLVVLAAVAVVLRVILAVRSPTPYGYVYDFYHEAIQRFYVNGRLPIAADCWQCYQPPLLTLAGLPFYALGKWLLGGPGGLADPALRVVAVLSLICAGGAAYYGYRLLRALSFTGAELIIGTGLILACPCLFISSWGIEADILLTALMVAFLYYLVVWFNAPASGGYVHVVRLGLLAGLACETKYSGIVAPVVLALVAGIRIVTGPERARVARRTAAALLICVAVGSWKYIDNINRYHTLLFANGSAGNGFAVSGAPSYAHLYDFHTLHLGELSTLVHGKAPRGHLTDLPFYRSVWTTLHAMAWSDMTMFSDPSRHGFSRGPYPRKAISPALTMAVLTLGLVPDGLAILGVVATIRQRRLWPLAIMAAVTFAVYVRWFLAQESWALKTKYLLFLLPVYAIYALLGWRQIGAWSSRAGRVVFALLVLLICAAHLYLLDFAWS